MFIFLISLEIKKINPERIRNLSSKYALISLMIPLNQNALKRINIKTGVTNNFTESAFTVRKKKNIIEKLPLLI